MLGTVYSRVLSKSYLGKKRINYDRNAERGRDERPLSEREGEEEGDNLFGFLSCFVWEF